MRCRLFSWAAVHDGEATPASSARERKRLGARPWPQSPSSDHFRPGMVSVVQTSGDGAKFHPHLHALCSRGGWTPSGEWIPLPYVDEAAAEKLF